MEVTTNILTAGEYATSHPNTQSHTRASSTASLDIADLFPSGSDSTATHSSVDADPERDALVAECSEFAEDCDRREEDIASSHDGCDDGLNLDGFSEGSGDSASRLLISRSDQDPIPGAEVIYSNTHPTDSSRSNGFCSVHSYTSGVRDACVSESSYDYIASNHCGDPEQLSRSLHSHSDIFRQLRLRHPDQYHISDTELSYRDTDSCRIHAKWNTNPVRICDVRPCQLPGLWRILNIHSSRSLPDQPTFRRQYTRKGTGVDAMGTPLILSTMRKSSKVFASMIQYDEEKEDFKEVGPQLVIPVNYKGWFQHVENNDTKIHNLSTIGDVANAEIKEFLVHSPITAFRYAKRSDDGDKLYSKVQVPAGEVLTTRSVLTEWLSNDSVQKGCLCIRHHKRKPDLSYLKVRDGSSKRLLLPFETTGGFSEVGQRGGETRPDASYQLTDIARWVQLPVQLKLVCGELPEGLKDSTGVFRLEQLSFETSVFGCTVNGEEREMVEFPMDTELDLVPCRNWADVKSTGDVDTALVDCENNMEEFVTSVKVVQDVSPEEPVPDMTNTLSTNMNTLVRSLPPTPLLPRCVKHKKRRGWSWAKSLLAKYKKTRRVHDGVSSENSDYEVIPFYLRTVNSHTDDDKSAILCDALERTNFAMYNPGYAVSDRDIDSLRASTLPGTPPPPPVLRVRAASKAMSDGAHDEDGYLLPIEVRDTQKILPQSPFSGKNTLSISYQSTHPETCSSATITRELDAAHSLDKSTETLLAPPSSSTVHTHVVPESDYASAPKFDKQRLDSFLSDSLHELRRRQSRELLTENGDGRQKVCRSCSAPQRREGPLPTIESQTDVTTYLDKIFDCDSMSDEKGQSSHSSSTTTGIQTNYRRSMSVPESMLPRLDHLHRGSRQCLECGYQTLDSGIWLSPRSAVSDPYRQERDSGTYRSTSDCSWVPPENIEPLTVEEVGLSLRYIGMKDYIVTRFYEEQIDGKQLTELTNQLLIEGFPDLNALDRKKLCDFVNGWRPKKWGYVSAE